MYGEGGITGCIVPDGVVVGPSQVRDGSDDRDAGGVRGGLIGGPVG